MQLRLIAGRAFGLGSPVRTQSPLFYLHWELQPGTEVELPAAVASERAVHVAAGAVTVDGQPLHAGEMLVLGQGDVRIRATGPAIVMALANPSVRATSTGTSCRPRASASSRPGPTGLPAA